MKISELQKGKTYYVLKYTAELMGLVSLETFDEKDIFMAKATFNQIIGDLHTNTHIALEFFINEKNTSPLIIYIYVNYPQYHEIKYSNNDKEILDITPNYIITTSKIAMKKILRNKLKLTSIEPINTFLTDLVIQQKIQLSHIKQIHYKKLLQKLKQI